MDSPLAFDNGHPSFRQFSIQELIQILLNEDRSKKYLSNYSVGGPALSSKAEKMREKIQLAVKQNGFEYFIDRLIEKQVYLSAPVRGEIELYLTSQNSISDSLRKKVG